MERRCCSLPLLSAASASYLFGVLRRDGVVVPFARLEGSSWRHAWFRLNPIPEVPVDLRSVPKRWWGPTGAVDTWYATTPARGDALAPLRVVQPDIIPAYCGRQIGLRTDYAAAEPKPPIGDHPYPKDGLAVAPRVEGVRRIDIIDPGAPEAIGLVDVVNDAFNEIERNIYGHPIRPKDREAIRPEVESVYAYGDRARYYYVEAAREYREHGATDRCSAAAVGHVWIVRDEGRPTALSTSVVVQDCDRSEAIYMTPLGIVTAGGKTFWIAQFAGSEDESYQVIELKPRAVEAALIGTGGSC